MVPALLGPSGAILATMARRPGHVFTRDALLDAIGDTGQRDERSMDTYIRRLRQRRRAVDPDCDGVETVYGLGYRWRA